MTFFADCEPPRTTSQMKGVRVVAGRPIFFRKATTKAAIHVIAAALAPFIPDSPLEGPLVFSLDIVFPFRKCDGKAIRSRDRVWHEPKPDGANVSKGIEDAMTEMGFWLDDAQLVDSRIRKFRGRRPGLGITIEPAPEP